MKTQGAYVMHRIYYLLAVFLLGGLPAAQADWVMKQEIITDMSQTQTPAGMKNMPGMDPTTETQTMFTRADAVRIERAEGQVVIMRLRDKKLTIVIIDTIKQTYSDATQMLPMMSMGAMFFVNCNQQGTCKERKDFVTATGNETRMISGFKTHKATMNMPQGMMMGGSAPTVWMTKDSKELAAEERARINLFAQGLASMGMPTANIPELVQKSYDGVVAQFGVPVETVMEMGMMKSITRVVSIEEKKLSDELFEVPKGYKETAMFPGIPGGMPPQSIMP